MNDLLQMLPEAILYIASGFAFVMGFNFLIEKRYDFFSEVGLAIMLVVGFFCVNILQVIPAPFVLENPNLRSVVIVLVSALLGIATATLRNWAGTRLNRFMIQTGKRRTTAKMFWYDRLDTNELPVWLRLVSYEQEYILEGVLVSLSETEDNPYLLLAYCTRYSLDGSVLDSQYANSKLVQYVVRADMFEEVILLYDERSKIPTDLDVK